MTNTKVHEFYLNLYDVINSSELTLGTAYFVLKSVFKDLEAAYQNALIQEQRQGTEQERIMEIPMNMETLPAVTEEEVYEK